MMAEVKAKILENLKRIENSEFLNHLLDLVQNVDNNGVYQFSSRQKSEIDESISQIERGKFQTHNEVMKKYRK